MTNEGAELSEAAEVDVEIANRDHLGDANKRVAASTVSLVASNITVGLLGLLTLHVLTNRLGKPSYGVLVSVFAFISATLLFADLGINTFSGREIARRREEPSVILSQNLGLRLVMSALMMPAIILLGIAFPHSETARVEGIALCAFAIPCEAVRSVSLSFYVATIQNYKSALIGLFSQVIYVAGAITAVYLGFSVVGCFAAWDLSMLVTAATAYLMVRRSVHFVPRFHPKLWAGIVKQSFGVGAIQIVNLLYLRMNTNLLTALTAHHVYSTVAQYGVAASFVTNLLAIPNAFMLSMLPVLVAAPLANLTGLVNRAAVIMAITGTLAVVGTTCLASDLVKVVVGKSYLGAIPTLEILNVSVLFTCLTAVFTYSSFARDHHRRLLLVSTAGLFANVGLDFLLIPSMGARGAAISTVGVEFALLIGTYLMFRNRVGNHFTAWFKIARIFLAGGASYFVSRVVLDAVAPPGRSQLLIGLALVPLAFAAAAVAFRCLPDGLSVSRLLRSGKSALHL
jgi:O-antigen/teichoic acid export membrane protein